MKNKIYLWTISTLFLIILSLGVYATVASDSALPADDGSLNCRMYGAISNNFPDGFIQKTMYNDPFSLKNMSSNLVNTELSYNINGWGIATYSNFGDSAVIYRGEIRAYSDPLYTTTISNLDSSEPKIVLAHVRRCTSGCCTPIETVENPHPFKRIINGKTYTFMHNGGVTKTTMINLIGASYLTASAPFGSGVPECNTTNYNADVVVDSELYFLYIKKMIEENGGNAVLGISAAIKGMAAVGATSGSVNFLMSDGETLYGFKKGNELFYKYDAANGYSQVASQPTNTSESGWITLNDWQLVILKNGQAPVVINDVRTYVTPNVTISNPNPQNNSNVSSLSQLNFTITESNNGMMNYTVTTIPNVGSRVGTNVLGGVISVPVSGLVSGTTYTWTVTLTNGLVTENKIYSFYYFVPLQPPIISAPTPSNGEVVFTAPTQLRFTLNDPNNDRMSYSVTTSPNVGSRVGTNVSNGVISVPVSGLVSGTTYNWQITANDGSSSSQANYTFTYQSSQGDVVMSQVYPNNTKNANYNPRLSVNINDPQNAQLTVVFETNATGSWTEIGRYENGRNGVYTQDTSGMDVKNRRYYWRVNVYDGNSWTTQTYNFVAQAFALKWTYNMNVKASLGPLAVDVNNDGIYEVFTTGEDKITCLDGATGRSLWVYNNSQITYHSPIEIGDLNNDDAPEIVVAANDRTIALHTNDGSVYWNVPVKSQDHHIVIVDTEGNGYPYVYVTSEDITQLENGTGRLRKLRGTNGAVLAEAFSWRPCWGGLSADDANNDGKFEIYMTDRKVDYTPGELGKGMQAYDADTLELLWYEDDVTCSSHMMALIDVNNDDVRDAVAIQQSTTNGGLYVIDGATGVKMPGKWTNSIGLLGHSPFSIWDIDGDDNLELITSRDSVAKVWDVSSWKLDATLDYFAEPPKMADVIGDSKLEIIGVQNNTIIYSGNYDNIENISSPGHASSLVQDIDNDGQNELIIISYDGLVRVYDTSAYAPTPRVRTNNLYYSERRLGVGVYVPPIGAPQPFVKEETPSNNSLNVSLNPTLSFDAVDYRHDKLDITISTDVSGSWETVATFKNVSNGKYSYTPINMNDGDTTYHWRVSVTDSGADNITTTKLFSFTTQEITSTWQMNGWNYRKQITIDHTKVSGNLTNFPVLVEFTDANMVGKTQNDVDDILFTSADGVSKLSHEIESYDSSNGHLVAWVNVPILSSVDDTILYMYYGNLNASNQQNPEAVWDSNYLAVQHLEETSGNSTDSTSKNNDGTPLNGVAQSVVGKIDGGDRFDGINDRTQLPQVFTNQNTYTMEGWMNTANKQGYLFSQRDLSSRGSFIQHSTNGLLQFYVNGNYIQKATTINSWHYVVGTFNGTTARLFIDGVLSVSGSSTITWPNEALYIGDRSAGSRNFQGSLDEVRLSDVARSEAYIKTSYANQNSPSSFIVLGSEESATTKPIVSNVAPADEAIEVLVNTSELSFDLSDNQNDLMSYTLATSPDVGFASGTNVPNGHYIINISGLAPNSAYTWYLNVTDGNEWTRKIFTFTTKFECVDSDGDGYNVTGGICGLIDCNDDDSNINPVAVDVCGNGIDEDCSGADSECPTLLKDSTFDASADSADLRANSLTQDWYESRAQTPTLLTLDNSSISGNTGNKARLSGTTVSTQNAYLTQEFREPQTNDFTVEWDILVENIVSATPNRTGMTLIGDDTFAGNGPNADNSERFVYLGFSNYNKAPGKMDLVARDRDDAFTAGSFTVVSSDLNIGQWYNIRVSLNLTADTYDVYVDNVFQRTVTSRIVKSSVSHISFATWNDGAGTFYVDNVKEYIYVPVVCTDADNDTYAVEGSECGLVDCNDNNAEINPGANDSLCDGVDNNCNGNIDESYVANSTSCGIGACASTGLLQCSNGTIVDSCIVGIPALTDETCNNVDENCNGFVDEEYVSTSTSCGLGLCAAAGSLTCVAGVELDSCIAGNATDELCDNQDNDCDGNIDNVPTSVSYCGLGACGANTGILSCSAGNWYDSCDPLQGAVAEVCDGVVDDDCDGIVDEGCECTNGETRACGSDVGSCVAGTQSCVAGSWSAECVGEINATEELCDNQDNDCDGVVDEDLISLAPNQFGLCAGNMLSCNDGEWAPAFGSYVPTEELCDMSDNDCDGIVDEDIASTPTTCGVGYCAAAGQLSCVGGIMLDSCAAGEPVTEICGNEIDDDCDGLVDEDCVSDPEVCDDGMDNDGDGDIDCADSDCSEFLACQDLCGNGVIDQDVYHNEDCDDSNSNNGDGCSATCYVEEDWICEGEPSTCTIYPEACGGADFNGDTNVDLQDLTILTNNFDRTDCTSANNHCDGADLNKDGSVTGADLRLFTPNFGLTNCEEQCVASTEICDGIDNDCDELVDEEGVCVVEIDEDEDGYNSTVDCNDNNPEINPGATEVCDGMDNDCDGMADDNLETQLNPMQAGVCAGSEMSCQGVSGWMNSYPPTYEIIETSCDTLDNDCDGSVDEGDVCVVPAVCGNGDVEETEACDDNNINSGDGCSNVCIVESGYTCVGNPSVCTLDCVATTEVCDGIDNDCDGSTDENLAAPLNHLQMGVCSGSTMICQGASGWGDSYPSSYEIMELSCDGIDNDCDGAVDEDLNSQLAPNQVGVCAGSTMVCQGVSGWTTAYDLNSTYEFVESSCDGLDNDCDGIVDEDIASTPTTCGVGYCAAAGQLSCVGGNMQDTCTVGTPTTEICGNGIDENCDGADEICIVQLFADSTFDASLDSADLRFNGVGQDWYESRANWTGGNANLVTLDASTVGSNSGNKTAFKNYGLGSVGTNAYLTQNFTSQSETFNVSFDIYLDRIEDNAGYDRAALIYIGDDSVTTNCPTGTGNERFVFLTFYDATPGDTGSDLEIRARTLTASPESAATTSTWYSVTTGLSYDTWYNIMIVLKPATGKYDVYVNNVLVKADVPKYAGYPSANSIKFISFSADSDGRGDFYIDNVYSPALN